MSFTDEERYHSEWEDSDDCQSSGISCDEYSHNREVEEYGSTDEELDSGDDDNI